MEPTPVADLSSTTGPPELPWLSHNLSSNIQSSPKSNLPLSSFPAFYPVTLSSRFFSPVFSKIFITSAFLAASLVACGDDDGGDVGVDTPVDTERDTGPDLSCDMEGVMRTAACGMCGTEAQLCQSGNWMAQSECLNQGECQVGQVETEDTERCGQRQRICLDGCTWGAWSVLAEPGACEAGEPAQSACVDGVTVPVTCNADCTLPEPTAEQCMTDCGPRFTFEGDNPLLERICIPGGETTIHYEYVEGGNTLRGSRVATLTPYWMMRYPVSYGSYQECVNDGECEPAREDVAMFYGTAPGSLAPVDSDRNALASSEALCARLNGRVNSLAEVYRAARGDCAVYSNLPWADCDTATDDDSLSCDVFTDCREDCADGTNSICNGAVNSFPQTAGVHGPELLAGGVSWFASDEFEGSELGTRYESTDPYFPGGSGTFGHEFGGLHSSFGIAGFRCVWRNN